MSFRFASVVQLVERGFCNPDAERVSQVQVLSLAPCHFNSVDRMMCSYRIRRRFDSYKWLQSHLCRGRIGIGKYFNYRVHRVNGLGRY